MDTTLETKTSTIEIRLNVTDRSQIELYTPRLEQLPGVKVTPVLLPKIVAEQTETPFIHTSDRGLFSGETGINRYIELTYAKGTIS